VTGSKGIIVAVLVALGVATVSAPSAGADVPCPVQYCTDSDGEYVLLVPALSPNHPVFGPYADCVWAVEVDFDDGTAEHYLFDAAVGLTGSHVFPEPGRTYIVQIGLTEGHHGQTTDPCPNLGLSAEVRFRTPAEETGDPDVPPPPPPPPTVPPDPGELVTPPSAASETATASPPDEPASAPESGPYWRNCRRGVYTHQVGCRKGRRVARSAVARLSRPGNVRAGGFSCRLPRGPLQSIACQGRGEQRILAPGPEAG
jgi:hypothetical protein